MKVGSSARRNGSSSAPVVSTLAFSPASRHPLQGESLSLQLAANSLDAGDESTTLNCTSGIGENDSEAANAEPAVISRTELDLFIQALRTHHAALQAGDKPRLSRSSTPISSGKATSILTIVEDGVVDQLPSGPARIRSTTTGSSSSKQRFSVEDGVSQNLSSYPDRTAFLLDAAMQALLESSSPTHSPSIVPSSSASRRQNALSPIRNKRNGEGVLSVGANVLGSAGGGGQYSPSLSPSILSRPPLRSKKTHKGTLAPSLAGEGGMADSIAFARRLDGERYGAGLAGSSPITSVSVEDDGKAQTGLSSSGKASKQRGRNVKKDSGVLAVDDDGVSIIKQMNSSVKRVRGSGERKKTPSSEVKSGSKRARYLGDVSNFVNSDITRAVVQDLGSAPTPPVAWPYFDASDSAEVRVAAALNMNGSEADAGATANFFRAHSNCGVVGIFPAAGIELSKANIDPSTFNSPSKRSVNIPVRRLLRGVRSILSYCA
jgi:hypothetical protein